MILKRIDSDSYSMKSFNRKTSLHSSFGTKRERMTQNSFRLDTNTCLCMRGLWLFCVLRIQFGENQSQVLMLLLRMSPTYEKNMETISRKSKKNCVRGIKIFPKTIQPKTAH